MHRICFVLMFLFAFFKLFSQDFILRTDGKIIQVKIDEIGMDIIQYHDYINLNGEAKSIEKNDVAKIYFENGGTQLFGNKIIDDSILIAETKKSIVENINNYGFIYRFPKQRFKASFEGKFLRIDFLSKKTNEPASGISYDFSTVYSFDGVSLRKDDKAYVNIWASILLNKKKNNWKKGKFVFGVHGHDKAYEIMGFIKLYNTLLLENTDALTHGRGFLLKSELNFQKV